MRLKRIVSAALLVASAFSSTVSYAEIDTSYFGDEYRVLQQVAELAADLYIDDSVTEEWILKNGLSEYIKENPEELSKILNSMIGQLDPYSEVFTWDEYVQYSNDLNKAFYGIGVVIQKSGDYVEITGFTDESPSARAGIKQGDKIVGVDGVDTKGKSMDEVRSMIMGELGTDVSVTVLRGTENFTFTITRSMVKQNTVECVKVSDNVAYISISDMAMDTASEFETALKQVDRWGIKNIVLDLRSNGGGYLQSAISIARQIVPEGVIVSTEYRDAVNNDVYMSELKNTKYNFNVLVNEYTASAAEILASAIGESGAGKIIGKTTYGKAVIQGAYRLIDGIILKITVGKYITRNGNEINEEGIEPEYKVSNISHPIDTSKYTQFDYKTLWTVGSKSDAVLAAKERLYLLGYYNGNLDQDFTDTLKSAIEKFQTDAGLAVDGRLDNITQVQIENAFAKLEVVEDLQYKKAMELFGVTVE